MTAVELVLGAAAAVEEGRPVDFAWLRGELAVQHGQAVQAAAGRFMAEVIGGLQVGVCALERGDRGAALAAVGRALRFPSCAVPDDVAVLPGGGR